MAFDVTPTSGAAPYTLTASFANEESFSLGYALRFTASDDIVGTCPSPNSATSVFPSVASLLLESGSAVRSDSVPQGACRVYKLEVRSSFGEVVDMQYVHVDNI